MMMRIADMELWECRWRHHVWAEQVIPAVFGLLAVWTGADSYPVYLLVLLAALSLTAGKAVRYQM